MVELCLEMKTTRKNMREFKTRTILLCALSIVIIGGNCFGQNPAKTEKLDHLLTMLSNQNQFNGNILIAEKGIPIFRKSYGIRNKASKQTLNPNSVFRLASVSKQFTAMGVVILAEKGKLSYEDKIGKYIPELAFYKEVTIRQLLNHTGGLPDYMTVFSQHWDKTKVARNKDVINIFGQHTPKIVFNPGAKFKYSNTGYVILASIIEKISSISYAKFLERNIFKPLKMKHTFVHADKKKQQKEPNYALGYVWSDTSDQKVLSSKSRNAKHFYYLGGIVGDGGVNSTLDDLLKWDRALYTNKFVSPEGLREIYTPSKTLNGKTNRYGFGWSVRNSPKYGKIVNHSGSWAGYRTFIERHLDNDKTIIILQNFAEVALPIKNVRETLYGQPLTKIYRKEIKLSKEILSKHVGKYATKSDSKSIISISKRNDYLIYNATEQPWNMKFYPESRNLFFSKNARFNIQIEFKKNSAGHYKIILYQNNKVIEEGTKKTN